jgi:hypothetical protein
MCPCQSSDMDVHLCARVIVCAIRMAEMMADVENTTPCARINNPVLESTTADTPPATPSSTRTSSLSPLLLLLSSTCLHHNNSSQVSRSILLLHLHRSTTTTLPSQPNLSLCTAPSPIINLSRSRSIPRFPPPRVACISVQFLQFQSVKPAANATAALYLHSASCILHSTSAQTPNTAAGNSR